MEASSFLPQNIPTLPRRQFRTKSSNNFNYYNISNKRFVINAKQGDGEGKSVDEGMVVLRMRIKKIKALEAAAGGGGGDEERPAAPPDWKEWEKKLFGKYQEGVSESTEALQSYLMKARPSVALGMLALAALTVPLSSSAVMASALKVARGLLAGCHVCIDIDF